MNNRTHLRSLIRLAVLLGFLSSLAALPMGPLRFVAPIAYADSGLCASAGVDGPAVGLGGIVNSYFPGTASVAAGATQIDLGPADAAGAPAPIAPGDLLLVIQMQGATITPTNDASYGANNGSGSGATAITAGRYEYVVAASTLPGAGGTLTIRGMSGGGLQYAYTTANPVAASSQGQQRFQVIRVPQYSSATLAAATPLTAPYWNGSTGGVVALDVAGQLAMNGGTIDVSARGFRGGGGRQIFGDGTIASTDFRTPAGAGVNGAKGEGLAGTPRFVYDPVTAARIDLAPAGGEGYPDGGAARGAPGNAGGGGSDGNPAGNDQNSGGGGGGNGGAGGVGGNSWASNLPLGGRGGAAFAATPASVVMGGGGGAGTNNNGTGMPIDGVASSGASGGGIVMVRAGSVSGVGAVRANGANALVLDNDSPGGGGAGGSIIFATATGTLGSLALSANGGTGGSSWLMMDPGDPIAGTRHGPGGGGGGGVVLHTAPGAAAISVAGGPGGVATSSHEPYGALIGSDGISQLIAPADLTTGSSGALCLPALTVAKTTGTPQITRLASGAVATYTITVRNAAGRSPATNVAIDDVLPAGFTFRAVQSFTFTGGASRSAIVDPVAGSAAPAWRDFSIPGGASVVLQLSVDVAPGVDVGTYRNSAGVTYLDPQRTTAAGTATTPRASADVSVVAPQLVALKRDRIAIDQNGNSLADPGDTLEYTVVINNTGGGAALGLTFADTPDANTALVVGSVATDLVGTTITRGNAAGDTSAAVTLGGLAPGGSLTITFRALINTPLPASVTEIANQGRVQGSNVSSVPTDDPDTPAPGDPTVTRIAPRPAAVTLTSFSATWGGAGMAVRWTTAMELGTRGFALYRSPDRDRAHAILVTPKLIPAQGRGQGGSSYEWVDSGVAPGASVTYWLAEEETDGTVNEYGPALAVGQELSAQYRIALPLILR